MSPGTPNPSTWRKAWEVTAESGNGDREVIAYLPEAFNRAQIDAAMVALHESAAMTDDSDRFDVVLKWKHPQMPTERPSWDKTGLRAELDMVDSRELVARRVEARIVGDEFQVRRGAPRAESPAARYRDGLDP